MSNIKVSEMGDSEVVNILRKWKMSEETIQNFKVKRVKKEHFCKFTDAHIQELIPAFDDRMDFLDHLKELKDGKEELLNTGNTPTPDITMYECQQFQGGNLIAIGPPKNNPQQAVNIEEGAYMSQLEELLDLTEDHETVIPLMTTSAESKSPSEPSKTLRRIDFTDKEGELESIICKSNDGLCVLSSYKKENRLAEPQRNIIGDIIVLEEIKHDLDKSFSDERVIYWAKQVVELFPTELLVTWTGETQNARETSAGRGKILLRYYNRRRKMRECGLIGNTKTSRPNRQETDFGDANVEYDDEEDYINNIEWLKNHKTPWSEVEDRWEKTSVRRVRDLVKGTTSIHEYINSFPGLKDANGYLLLEIDFRILFPDKEMKLYVEWPMLSAFIIRHLKAKEKEAIEDCLTSDGKKLKTLQSINYLFPVVTACRTKNKKQFRPSRAESIDSFIMVTESPADIQSNINDRAKRYAEFSLPYSVQVAVVGQTLDAITHCFVRINEVSYQVETPLKALDLAFKLTHVLDALYPVECRREMFFLQRAVYDIVTKNDSKISDTKTKCLIEEYRQFKVTK